MIFRLNNNGSALLMTIMITTSVLTVALGVAALVLPGVIMGRTQFRSTKAYFAAETGAERVLLAARVSGFDPGTCAVGQYVDFNANNCTNSLTSTTLSNGSSYYVRYESSTLPATVTFNSVGSFLGTNRTVEISY